MATELNMPQMGYDMEEGTVVRWLKHEGEEVSKGESIAEIETDKAVVEFQSIADGILSRILVPEGRTVPVGQALALIGEAGEEILDQELRDPLNSSDERQPLNTETVDKFEEIEPTTSPSVADEVGQVRASPVARRIADERGIDLAQVVGTGPGGRITREDVESHAAPEFVSEPEAVPDVDYQVELEPEDDTQSDAIEPLSRMRQQIARITVRSKAEAPHFYVSSEIDMTQAMEMRAQVNQSPEFSDTSVSVNDLVLKACIGALKQHPKFNATFTRSGIEIHDYINMGMAVANENGLIVPAIMNAQEMSLKEVAVASRDLATRSRGGTLGSDEYTKGTFMVSNLGMFNVSGFTAIIHPPQAAVIAVGAVTKKPVVKEGQIDIADIMQATLSADHRIVDGAEGARFIEEVKSILENPYQLLV